MNVLRITILAAVGSLLLGSFEAVASEDNCVVYTAAQRASWVAGVARRLHNHDPAHAAKMSKVASEIINGEVDALKSDIDSGLDSNAVLKFGEKAASGMSLLTLAAAACQRAVAEQLIAAGASVNGADDSTPLVAAGASGATSVAALLIAHGASVEKVDENGHTALEDAVRQRHLDTVQMLLSQGSDPNRMVGGGPGTIVDLVAHSSSPIDHAIEKALRARGAGAALTSTQ
jgi:ankyrin repeat protein